MFKNMEACAETSSTIPNNNGTMNTTPASERLKDKTCFPLNECYGEKVCNTGKKNYCGLFRTGSDNTAPKWTYANNECGLYFSGGNGAGFVEILHGGEILFGPHFEISIEIRPEDINAAGAVLTCKHGSQHDGGFSLFYWGARKELIFDFADGQGIYTFRRILEKPIQPGQWTPIAIAYNGRDLTFRVGDEKIQIFYKPGLLMTKSNNPLLIGGYYNDLAAGFSGRIRNVTFGAPKVEESVIKNKDNPYSLRNTLRNTVTNINKKLLAWNENPGIVPVGETIFVANNMIVPNWFKWQTTEKNVVSSQAVYFLDIPEHVELVAIGNLKKYSGWLVTPSFKYKLVGAIQHDGKLYTRFIIKPFKTDGRSDLFGPIFLSSALPDGSKSYIYYKASWDNGRQEEERVALHTRTFPTPGMLQKLHTSIGFMLAIQAKSWPGFFDAYGKLGFNTVPIHGLYDKILGDLRIDFIKQCRAKGYYLLYNDSPFHALSRHTESSSVSEKTEKKHDICPAYRGTFYKKEVSRIAELAYKWKPDYSFWDIECFAEGAFAGLTGLCQRCTEYIRKSGKHAPEAITGLGLEMIFDLQKAIAEKLTPSSKKIPRIGVYHTKPHFVYQDTFDFEKFYERGADFCMPVFYDSKKRNKMGEELRSIRNLMEKGDIIPWLQPGTISDYPSPWIYDGVMESFGSGTRGITWYAFMDMTGEDLFYFAKAMEVIKPVEDIIYDSKPVEGIHSENPQISATAICRGDEYLFLISDYSSDPFEGELTVTLQNAISGQVWDLARNKPGGQNQNNVIKINFSPGVKGAHSALYYVGKRTVK